MAPPRLTRRRQTQILAACGATATIGGAILLVIVAQGVWVRDLSALLLIPGIALMALGAAASRVSANRRVREWQRHADAGY